LETFKADEARRNLADSEERSPHLKGLSAKFLKLKVLAKSICLAHNLKVTGQNPVRASKKELMLDGVFRVRLPSARDLRQVIEVDEDRE
jgi:hypothetical protein